MNTHPRMNELCICPEDTAFTVTNNELFAAIAEEVDLETVTDQELREIICIIMKNLQNLNWQELVSDSVLHLPFGLNQTEIAWNGHYPCTGCPDAMLFDGNCYHQGECKAWEIYEVRL